MIDLIIEELRAEVEQTAARGGTKRAGLEAAIGRIEAMRPALTQADDDRGERTAEAVLLTIVHRLADEKEWTSSTLDDVATILLNAGYAHVDDDALFAGGPA